MGNRVGNSLKYSVHGKLRGFDPIGGFDGKNTHVSRNKLTGFSNLDIERAGDVLGVQLIGGVSFSTPIADSLNEGTGHERRIRPFLS